MKTLTNQQEITCLLLFILLACRISVDILEFMYLIFLKMNVFPAWVDMIKVVFPIVNTFYNLGAFGLIAIAILLNKDDIQSLNIDKFFILVFLYSGLATFWEHILDLSWLIGVAWFLFFIYVLKNRMRFNIPNPSAERISLIITGIFAVCFIAVVWFIDLPKILQVIHLFFLQTIPNVAYEEVIFRGMLWKFLKNLQWNESKIVLAQAILFWLAHIRYLILNPFDFWIFVPLTGLLLGYIVLRSKSITPSTIAHMLINLLYGSLIISR